MAAKGASAPRRSPSTGAIALVYVATFACVVWAMAVLLGFTTTQGFAVPVMGIALAMAPSAAALVCAGILIRRAQRARRFGARMWWLLPPAGVAAYLVLAGTVSLLAD